jgi:hypothetical protein
MVIRTLFPGGGLVWPDLVVLALWPSSIMLLATAEGGLTVMGITILVISVLVNQVLYFMVGALVGYFYYRSVN